MKVRRVATTFELLSLQPVWNGIVGECPLHSWQWLHSWWETFETNRELFVLVCETLDHKVAGILPLCVKRQLASGDTLTFLGSGKACTEYLSMFTKMNLESEVASAFATWLIENGRSWDHIDLENTRSDDPNIALLLSALRKQEAEIGTVEGEVCWRIHLPNSQDEYIDTLAKRFRRKFRDAFRKVIDTDVCTTKVIQSHAELKVMFEQFVDLHIRRRKELDGDHCFQSEKFCEFLSLASHRLHDAGMLDLTSMRIDNTVASIHFGMKDRETFYLYQSGMNPDSQQYSPGWTTNCAKIADSINKGLKYYDLLRGDEAYKRHLGATPVETTHYRIAAPQTTSRIRHQLWKTKQTMRDWRETLVPSEH